MLKPSVMNSLPEPVLQRLQAIVTLLEDGLQERVHKVDTARRADRAFRRRFTESPLRRSLLCDIVSSANIPGIRVHELGNGGCELSIVHAGIERRFRFKNATLDKYGRLVVTASSDSILTPQPRPATLWDPEEASTARAFEQWVLAYLLDPHTRTFAGVTAGRVVGIKNGRSPFKLLLDDLIPFIITSPTAASFLGDDDDLDLGEDGEAGEAGEDAG